MAITLTDSAAARINELTETADYAGKALRLLVDAGGCSGYEYKFSFADSQGADDESFSHNGATLLVDKLSLGLLDGSTLDYKTSLMAAQFQVINPNAASGCGCGSSFSLKEA